MKQPKIFPLRSIIETQQFDPEILSTILLAVDYYRACLSGKNGNGAKAIPSREYLEQKLMAMVFLEPAPLTRLSFETAMLRLSGKVVAVDNLPSQFKDSKKITPTELTDSIRSIGAMADIIVLHHSQAGAAKIAAEASAVPIINIGEVDGQNPTQTLIDLYVIWHKLKRLENLKVAIVGDLFNCDEARSLVYLLAKYPGNKFIFVSPPSLGMHDDIKDYLIRHDVEFSESGSLEASVVDCDLLYVSRVKRGRFNKAASYLEMANKFIVSPEIADSMKPDGIILHRLPRDIELPIQIDRDPRAAYLLKPEFGLYVCMALIDLLLCGSTLGFEGRDDGQGVSIQGSTLH